MKYITEYIYHFIYLVVIIAIITYFCESKRDFGRQSFVMGWKYSYKSITNALKDQKDHIDFKDLMVADSLLYESHVK